MYNYRKVYPSYWVGKTASELRKQGMCAHFMAFNLMTNAHANMLGIYHLPIAYLAYDLAISHEQALAALDKLCKLGFCRYDPESEYIWIINMAKYQIEASLKPQDKRVKNVQKLYQSLPDLPFLAEFYQKYQACFHLKPHPKQDEQVDPLGHDLIIASLVKYIQENRQANSELLDKIVLLLLAHTQTIAGQAHIKGGYYDA